MILVATTPGDRARCYAIRLNVFVREQGVPADLEIDDADDAPTTVHLLATRAGHDVGTARILVEAPGHCHVGRVAVERSARGTGVGKELMAFAADFACAQFADSQGTVTLALSAQLHAIGFYESCGYTLVPGEQYLDAGIWHRDMVRVLS
ncbi:MAG: GNAT family N-acetyltransferase [Ancrocorticia sp.]|jgi:Predicted acyltransferase|nr:GNAT family N-acetyltransferase [Ancrocorticia sp.]MCI1895321.1 GNAT family N-acetyltransferase [Ancrocorticia sp.]MCI1932072.1 GNAT family N-acetyltransferase [Ancrocorticia sp.]MCI2012199.1 GNAT family N-acetyltransferase [Ancrocorticia sp.]MCI2028832.1 GNAT family N-acetyltransferase [Ancrocorticia sp.]